MSGKKFDNQKLKVHLLYKTLVGPLEDIARVLTFGANKYGEDNWQELDNGFDRYYAALIRHTNARLKGEKLDPESGLPHLAHAACCLLFMMFIDGKNNLGYRKDLNTGIRVPFDVIKKRSIYDNNGIHYGKHTKFEE